MSNIDYTCRDLESYKQMFLELVNQEFPNWLDRNESNLGNALAIFISMIGDSNSFYFDQMINQLLLPTATLRKYVILGCKALGYKPYSASPSTTEITFTIEAKNEDFIIPKGYPVGTKNIDDDGNYIRFETDESAIITAGNTTCTVSATQGKTIEKEYLGQSDGSANQVFKLEELNVIDGSITIYVVKNGIETIWSESDSLIGLLNREYFETERDEIERCYIKFGDGANGKIPQNGSEIYATYRVGGGEDTNTGIGTITENKGHLGEIISITNNVAATGGKDKEPIESAKTNAILHFKNTQRGVTQEDYDILPLSVEGVKRAKSILQEGNLIYTYIAADTTDGIPSEDLKQKVFEYMDERKIITFSVEIKDPFIVPVDVIVNGTASPDFYQNEVASLIQTKINEIFSVDNKDFGDKEQLGVVYKEVVSLDELTNVEITKLTTSPLIYPGIQTANPAHTFDTVTILQGNTLAGHWKVTMTSTTNFKVEFYDEETETWVDKGTGTIDNQFTSSGNEVQFTITSNGGTSAPDDYWEFYTNKYLGNIEVVNTNEIILAGNITINLTGGIV